MGAAAPRLSRRYNHLAGIGINGETLPCDANVLTLSDETDARGMRKARIDFGYSTNENRLNVHATKVMRDLWEAAGATDIWVLERVAHTLGTCRMGHDGDTAVVDPHGRSFEIDNLWISDGSTFRVRSPRTRPDDHGAGAADGGAIPGGGAVARLLPLACARIVAIDERGASASPSPLRGRGGLCVSRVGRGERRFRKMRETVLQREDVERELSTKLT